MLACVHCRCRAGDTWPLIAEQRSRNDSQNCSSIFFSGAAPNQTAGQIRTFAYQSKWIHILAKLADWYRPALDIILSAIITCAILCVADCANKHLKCEFKLRKITVNWQSAYDMFGSASPAQPSPPNNVVQFICNKLWRPTAAATALPIQLLR